MLPNRIVVHRGQNDQVIGSENIKSVASSTLVLFSRGQNGQVIRSVIHEGGSGREKNTNLCIQAHLGLELICADD